MPGGPRKSVVRLPPATGARRAAASTELPVRRLLPVLVLSLFSGSPSAASRDVTATGATVSAMLTAAPEDVHQALLEALSEWKLRVESLEDGLVKTEWAMRPKGDEMYRGRIVAEFQEQGYQTAVSVRHEKQRRADGERVTIGSQAARWQDVDGDGQVARDVLTSIEKALGHEEGPLQLGQRSPTRIIEIADCIVPPTAAARINELKSRRRDLVTEVRAMDQQILDAVDAGTLESMAGELDRIKARKASMQDQITAIDREILALVVAD